MKSVFVSVIVIVCFLSITGYTQETAPPVQTQLDINREACTKTDQTNKELEKIYQSIRTKYSQDEAFLKTLDASQKAWIAYRDAQIKMQYMPEHVMQYYGSRHPLCRCNTEKAMVEARIKELQMWLDRLPGNACP